MSPDERHGTYAGVNVHRREGSPPCEACKQAQREYIKQWRAKNPQDKVRTAARSRALWKLAAQHPEEFDRLYAAEARAALGQPRLDAEVVA